MKSKKISFILFILANIHAGSQCLFNLDLLDHCIQSGLKNNSENLLRYFDTCLTKSDERRNSLFNFNEIYQFKTGKRILDPGYSFINRDTISEEGKIFSSINFYNRLGYEFSGKENHLKVDKQSDHFLNAGYALLRRDTTDYSNEIVASYTSFSFAKDFEKIRLVKRKSPLLAGTMSALVPGLGKLYNGKPGSFIASLLSCGLLGIQAYETYNHGGFNSVPFYIYGSLFSVFYLGNIYGSYIGVKVSNQRKNDAINNHILLTMHLYIDELVQ
jgi:TM2 domain-containing membrane protein YozV